MVWCGWKRRKEGKDGYEKYLGKRMIEWPDRHRAFPTIWFFLLFGFLSLYVLHRSYVRSILEFREALEGRLDAV